MTVADLAPWLNLLLVPTVALLGRITNQLAALTATQAAHDQRLTILERTRP